MGNSIVKSGMAALAALLLAAGGHRADAAVAGAWETFFDQQNTDVWHVIDYADGKDYYPNWEGATSGDEYAYFTYGGDHMLLFFGDAAVGAGAFTGDYPAQRIAGIAVDVYIGDLPALDFLECRLYATGPYGKLDYYSPAFLREDFSGAGWWRVYFSFERPWYHWDGFDLVEFDAKTLTGIEKIQFAFVPTQGSAGGSMVGLDNVTLEPTIVAPQPKTSVIAGSPKQFRLAFTPGPGMECRVEKMRQAPASGWDTVLGQTGIKGPAEHFYQVPVTPVPGIFRVAAEPFYTMVFSP